LCVYVVGEANRVRHGFFRTIDTSEGKGKQGGWTGGQAGGRRITGGVNTIALISPELQAAIEAA